MMMMMKKTLLVVCLLTVSTTQAFGGDVALYEKLQDVSVTVKAAGSEGSGVIITREVSVGDTKRKKLILYGLLHML